MALFESHIRFAMDLDGRSQCSPNNNDHNFCGTTYSDSCWLSNISHELMHAKAIPNNMAISEDFKLGWLIHCRYDQIQNELQQTSPIPLDIISEDYWILYSAL
jgi:hypothetical protein